jgi:hypothetical protein
MNEPFSSHPQDYHDKTPEVVRDADGWCAWRASIRTITAAIAIGSNVFLTWFAPTRIGKRGYTALSRELHVRNLHHLAASSAYLLGASLDDALDCIKILC